MKEWGTPNWRDAEAYGDSESWHLWRWRWEFYRRRGDLREDYFKFSEKGYQLLSAMAEYPRLSGVRKETLKKPSDKDYHCRTPDCLEKYSYYTLPNPAFGNHPLFEIRPVYDRDDRVEFVDPHGEAKVLKVDFEEGQYGVVFDLDRPLAPQFEVARKRLEERQKFRYGALVKTPRHRSKWLFYLRALDAREAGASLAEIAAILPSSYGRRDAKAADNVLSQARGLQFRF
ncbi:DUF2285 domain-containing protein [Rhodobacterales bacterium HKCCE3408]|nr:DUF2285 domain-containing protein [Rhodobacterales bacterium HKCCE3408]